MDRKGFDLLAEGFIEELHLLKKRNEERRGWELAREYLQSLDETGQRNLISDYEKHARKQMALFRDHAEAMVTLCQLREMEPGYFASSAVETVFHSIGVGLEHDAQQVLNAREFWMKLMDIVAELYRAKQQQAVPPAAKRAPMPKRGGPTR